MKLKIIANPHDLNSIQESWFVQNIVFNGAQIGVGFDPVKDANQTIVYLELNQINHGLIQAIKDIGSKVILYHMGDENAAVNRDGYAQCDLVIRNYFFNDIFCSVGLDEKIIWAPCGFKSGVGPRDVINLKSIDERQYLSIFSGWLGNQQSLNNERLVFSGAVKKCGSNLFLSATNGFGEGWNVGLYAAMMESAIFAPCPAGNSPETIRFYDALELGCIPISLRHEYLASKIALAEFGVPPVALLDSWEQLPDFLKEMEIKLHQSPRLIREWQTNCINWWTSFKKNKRSSIAKRLRD